MVLPTGDVVPGMKSSPITLDAAFVWCGALSPDGKTAYFGTGDQGRIYAVYTGATGGKARLLATLEAAWVTALAVRPDGTLIAGTTPGGRVYSVDAKSGKARLFATLTASTWALASTPRAGPCTRAPAAPGRRRRIDAGGRTRIWDSGDNTVAARRRYKHLYAGTSEEAILYKVGLDLRRGARRFRRRGGVRSRVFAVAVRGGQRFREERSGLGGAAPSAAAGTKVTDRGVGIARVGGVVARPGQRKAKPRSTARRRRAVWKLDVFDPDGYFTTLRSTRGAPTSYRQRRARVSRPPIAAALAIDVSERQALLLRAGNGFPGRNRRRRRRPPCAPAAPRQATYLSRVLDGEYRSPAVPLARHDDVIESRSGNTAKPDVT
jgi:hypothetical protein